MYITRTVEPKVLEIARHFPVLMLCGPRQTGKTTLLKILRERMTDGRHIAYVTLDDPMKRVVAKTDPALFLQQYQTPLIIDEIQYAPELLPYIKMRVDEHRVNGQYLLTGSQMFVMMRNVSESLAGRVGILNLHSFSARERLGLASKPFLPTPEYLSSCFDYPAPDVSRLFEQIFRGSMPQMVIDAELSPSTFFTSYVQTYLERDIHDIVSIRDEMRFLRFIACAAARSGQELNYQALARDAEIDNKTAAGWLSLLVSSGLVYLLPPYHSNAIKRIVKRPKLYFMDTGLCCYLARWNDPRTLELSAMAGALFETWVVSEILKSYSHNGRDIRNNMYYYRDNNGREIDLIIMDNNRIYPLEIKLSANPGPRAVRHFAVLEKMALTPSEGGVICMCKDIIPIDAHNRFIPVSCL